MQVAAILFQDFETLDIFGPVEILGRQTDKFTVQFYSLEGGLIHNLHGVSILTQSFDHIISELDILLIPGGPGTRELINNQVFIDRLKDLAHRSAYVLTVCTGSALLAKTGLTDGKEATSNKRAFDWVVNTNDNVNWIRKARWVQDGKYYTSSGVSAGMDMTLGFVSDLMGKEYARKIANQIEYTWMEDKENDPFA
ncbi:MAG: DJ-1/PfpI family protein [Saprospiraceae bacterium]